MQEVNRLVINSGYNTSSYQLSIRIIPWGFISSFVLICCDFLTFQQQVRYKKVGEENLLEEVHLLENAVLKFETQNFANGRNCCSLHTQW